MEKTFWRRWPTKVRTSSACSVHPDREGRPFDPIKQEATERDIPVFQFRRMRRKVAIDAFLELNADLCVMAFVTDIVPDEILEAPTHGTIQYHPSLLPKHRGPSSMNWPIIWGETVTGLSIFWPDKGLDTGPILLQKEVEITPDDTLGSLYFGKLYQMGVDAMVESVQMVRERACAQSSTRTIPRLPTKAGAGRTTS